MHGVGRASRVLFVLRERTGEQNVTLSGTELSRARRVTACDPTRSSTNDEELPAIFCSKSTGVGYD
jgi:hypothetical protein